MQVFDNEVAINMNMQTIRSISAGSYHNLALKLPMPLNTSGLRGQAPDSHRPHL
jgi:hypothetical protein